MESIKILRRELENKVPLIGFAGAPFTLASYAIEGHGTRDYEYCKALMWSDPQAWDGLMSKFTETVIAYLCAQIDAGAQTVQMFDSWVGYVAPRDYERFVLPYSKRVIEAVKAHGDKVVPDGGVPVIHFPNGATSMLDLAQQAGGDIIGVDWRLDMKQRRRADRSQVRHPGQHRPGRAVRTRRRARAHGRGDPRGGGYAAGPHLQPGPRHPQDERSREGQTMIRFVHEHSERIRAGE